MFDFTLILIFIALNVLDYILTQRILNYGGKELNPIVKALGLIPVKIGSFIILLFCYYFIGWITFAIANVIMAGVCIWNFRQYRKI